MQVDIHIQWAAFEEKMGNFDGASSVFRDIEERNPQLLSLMLARINLERRRGNLSGVATLYEAAVKAATSKEVGSDLSLKFARFLRLVQADPQRAVKVRPDTSGFNL